MQFTNTHPCSYRYTDSDENFSVDIDIWLEKAIPERKKKNDLILQEQNNTNSHMQHLPVKLTEEQFEQERLLYKYYNTSKHTEDGLPIEMSVEEIQSKLREDTGLIAPKAFDFIRKSFPNGACRFAITYIDKHSSHRAHKHLHPRIMDKDGKNIRECRACVVVIPLNHSSPATEKVFLNHQDPNGHTEELIMDLCRWTASPYETVRGQVTELLMPSMGQYLILDFMSSRCLHWVENYGTENEYLCLIVEN
jgi:hypothetical protein